MNKDNTNCSICNTNFIKKYSNKDWRAYLNSSWKKNHSNAVIAVLFSLQKNQAKIEEHIKTVHGEKNHSNVVLAMLISLQKNQTKIEDNVKTIHRKKTIQMRYL